MEKVKKDEKVARVEKEKIEERARTAEREHRLNILRSRANIETDRECDLNNKKKTEERFDLFPTQTQSQDPKEPKYSKTKSTKSGDDVLADHMKNDPIFQKPPKGSKNKTSSKDYSFV